MKATTWLCPVLTLLCATRIVCTVQRGGYPIDYADTNVLQDDYFLEKRNKPSLSIVNPLDVLRQRLLLEIARRQMKENTRQVELNRAILKNVGKRMQNWKHFGQQAQQQILQRQPFLFEMEYLPKGLTFDFLQRQQHGSHIGDATKIGYDEKTAFADAKKAMNIRDNDDDDNDDVAGENQLNENEIVNEITSHVEDGIESPSDTSSLTRAAALYTHGHLGKSAAGYDTNGKGFKLRDKQHDNNNNGNDYGNLKEEVAGLENGINDKAGNNDNAGGYHLRYPYRLHRNNFTKK